MRRHNIRHISIEVLGQVKVKQTHKKRVRTLKTYRNKEKRITTLYNRLYRRSIKAKQSFESLSPKQQKVEMRKRNNKLFFCDRYPTVESFLKNYKLKEVTQYVK
ncbi:MAG: hypothetical protein ACTSYR_02025 [Candidatus Odinarchaeia archaeon]